MFVFTFTGIALAVLFLVVLGAILSRPRSSSDEKKEKEAAQAFAPIEEEQMENVSWPGTPVTFTVSLTGDCTLGTDEAFDYDTSLNAYYDAYGSSYFFENVRSVFSGDDLTIVNMEGTLTEADEREDKLFAFKAPPAYADILVQGSVETATLANNHSHDYGEQSFTDTKTALQQAGVIPFGYEETAVVDVKGVNVGLVGIYELYDHMERASQVKENIAQVKEDGAQVVIVVFHWGNEKETEPDSNQTALGHLAIDEGADLVVGHHPHVLQGIEKYNGKFIVYSLGNFCFGGNAYPSDMDSMIFQQTFTVNSSGVEKNDAVNLIPCRISSAYEYNDYQPTLCDGEEKARILNKVRELSLSISDSFDFYFDRI